MAYLLNFHGFTLRCRCGDPSRCFWYLDRDGIIQSIHDLVKLDRNDPRFDCYDFADTQTANFLCPFDLAAVAGAVEIDNSTAKTAKEFGLTQFHEACALLKPYEKSWTALEHKAESILRLEDRAIRIARVLSVRVGGVEDGEIEEDRFHSQDADDDFEPIQTTLVLSDNDDGK